MAQLVCLRIDMLIDRLLHAQLLLQVLLSMQALRAPEGL
jgi:hypothetical protein